MAPGLTGLAPAERVAAAEVLPGFPNERIAGTSGKFECTVKNQVSAILTKFGVLAREWLMAVLRPAAGTSEDAALLR